MFIETFLDVSHSPSTFCLTHVIQFRDAGSGDILVLQKGNWEVEILSQSLKVSSLTREGAEL